MIPENVNHDHISEQLCGPSLCDKPKTCKCTAVNQVCTQTHIRKRVTTIAVLEPYIVVQLFKLLLQFRSILDDCSSFANEHAAACVWHHEHHAGLVVNHPVTLRREQSRTED